MSHSQRFWCRICDTDHRDGQGCPGEVVATGVERHGWRVNVETPRGIEAYGVVVAEAGDRWRARILTYPKILWLTPGGKGTIKFLGRTPQEAEAHAIEFVRSHCAQRGYRIREQLEEVSTDRFDMEIAPSVSEPPPFPPTVSPEATPAPEIVVQAPEPVVPTCDPGARSPAIALQPQQAVAEAPKIVAQAPEVTPAIQARRKIRFLPVQFGVVHTTEKGSTGNLSETGIFVITESPLESGQEVKLQLELQEERIPMRGEVRWARKDHNLGRSPGMGIHLDFPPQSYVEYVRALP